MSSIDLPGRRVWDIEPLFHGYPPVVKKLLRPLRHWCSCSTLWFKELRIFERPIVGGVPRQYRVDLYVKCHCCGSVEVFGIHVTEEEYFRIVEALPRRVLTWQEVYLKIGKHWNVNEPPIELEH